VATLKKKLPVFFWTILFLSFLLTSVGSAAVSSATPDKDTKKQVSYTIETVEWQQTTNEFILRVKGDAPPTYTMYELFEPLRVIIDIADASMSPTAGLPLEIPQGPVSQVNGKVLEDKEPFIARLELYLSNDSSYTVERLDNDIVVKFAFADTPATVTDTTAEAAAITEEALAPEIITETIEIPAEAIPNVALATEPEIVEVNATVLFDIEIERSAAETRVYLKADGKISDYRKVSLSKNVEAGRPDRMYIDVKNVRLAGPIPAKQVGTALGQVRTGQRTDGFRVVFDSNLDELFNYTISEKPDGMLITISEPSAATAVIADIIQEEGSDQVAEVTPEPEIFASAEEPVREPTRVDKPIRKPARQETSSPLFSGYTKQRITVDFYKIDLHNVFRLFGEISNLNMVVDESVNGSLTLALNDVPWDFALDIILNLKDLQKEERYNTIVISPMEKEFKWPEQALDNVDITIEQADTDVSQSTNGEIRVSSVQSEEPVTVIEAKKLIHQAQASERFGNYAAALPLYEDAFKKWPENIIIAKRIAAICLVHLGQNAKAVHYAKTSLRANPSDYDSALQAAIGLAKMTKTAQAEEFFKISVGGPIPSREALASYATFCEERKLYDRAMEILKQHEDIHGDSLDTMVSKARIHDKQGQRDVATSEYHAILLSGYEIPPDLERYIKGRASLANQ
jgi:type IV pilus assembly protein PilQ